MTDALDDVRKFLLNRLNLSRNERAAILFRGIQALSVLVSFKLIAHDRGVEALGFTSLILSLTTYFNFMDLGVVSLLRSEIPMAFALGGIRSRNNYIAYGLRKLSRYLACASVVIITFISLPYGFGFFVRFIRLPSTIAPSELQLALVMLCLAAGLTIFTNFGQAVFSANGRQYVVLERLAMGAVAQVFLVAGGLYLNFSQVAIIGLTILPAYLPAIPAIVRELFHAMKDVDAVPLVVKKGSVSFQFFFIQLIGVVANGMDTLLVAHFFSFGDVAVYSTLKMISQVPISLHGNYILQAWPIFSALRGRGDVEGVRLILHDRLVKTLLFFFIVGPSFFLLAPQLIKILGGGDLQVSTLTLISFNLQLLIFLVAACFSVLIFSFNYVRLLAILSPISPVLICLTTWALASIGLSAMILANALSQCLGLGVALYFYFIPLPRWMPSHDRQGAS